MNLGLMQGRLSPLRGNKIQSFPWRHWKEEFKKAADLHIHRIEWTIDQEDFDKNPLFANLDEIKELQKKYQIRIDSITNDEFMENPFWKTEGDAPQGNILKILDSMAELGITILVIPLVDNSSIYFSTPVEDQVVKFFTSLTPKLIESRAVIAFEVDLDPVDTMRFIRKFDEKLFGINYDMGNSASLGYNPADEIRMYGTRIINVHIKDRVYAGNSVPLGTGSTDFATIFRELRKIKYSGNFIFQTSRATDGKHSEVIAHAKDFVTGIVAQEID